MLINYANNNLRLLRVYHVPGNGLSPLYMLAQSSQSSHEVGNVFLAILWVRKLRLKVGK